MHLSHTKGTAAHRPPCRGPSPGVRAAIERDAFAEWEDEVEKELDLSLAKRLAEKLARKARGGLSAVRVTLSRENLYRGDFRRARRAAVDERPAGAAGLSDFFLPAAALLDRMLRECGAEGVTA